MTPAKLLELWNANKDRPAFVREYREHINEHTNTAEPVPDGSLWRVRHWMQKYKPVVTRQLTDAVDE